MTWDRLICCSRLTTNMLQTQGLCVINTGNDRYSRHGYSGIDRYSGTKNPDDAILFTVSGITAIVEQKFQKFRFFEAQSYKRPLIFSKNLQNLQNLQLFTVEPLL